MGNIKSINEFFGPFKKKSEFDKIAIEFINRMSKVKDYTNPYEIIRNFQPPTDIMEHLGITRYQIQFDDVHIEISNKTTVDLPKYREHYDLIVDGEEVECEQKYSEKLFKIIDSLYEKHLKIKKKEADIEKKRSDDEKANRISQNINKAADLLGEAREEKKPKSVYFTKRIQISKMDLDAICNELDLPFEELKFLSSGSFGNAYKVGDKVLKITTDKREAKTVYELLDEEQNESVIKYYDVSRYKLKNSYVYVIVMDYAKPLDRYLDEIGLTEFVDDITGVFFTEWGKLNSIDDYINEILEQTGWEIPKAGFGKIAVEKLWKMYENLNYLDSCPDFHIHNIGIKDNKDFVMFDFCDLGVVNKFDQPRIIASKSKMESMKYIEPIDEFFDFLKKDDEEDKIALEFIKRLEKVKDINPYNIEVIDKNDLPTSFKSKGIYDKFYRIIFDDVTLITATGVSSKSGSSFYKLMIDDEEVNCKEGYTKKIFSLTNSIYNSNVKRAKLNKLRNSINPAADALD